MQNQPRRTYPKVSAIEGTHQLTVRGDLHHINTIATTRVKEALQKADAIYHDQENDISRLGAIMMILADVPEEPLLTANKARTGSVLGLCALGFMVNHKQYGARARQIASSGEGQMILRVNGDVENPQCEIELFDTQEEYEAFLAPKLLSGNFVSVKGSSLL